MAKKSRNKNHSNSFMPWLACSFLLTPRTPFLLWRRSSKERLVLLPWVSMYMMLLKHAQHICHSNFCIYQNTSSLDFGSSKVAQYNQVHAQKFSKKNRLVPCSSVHIFWQPSWNDDVIIYVARTVVRCVEVPRVDLSVPACAQIISNRTYLEDIHKNVTNVPLSFVVALYCIQYLYFLEWISPSCSPLYSICTATDREWVSNHLWIVFALDSIRPRVVYQWRSSIVFKLPGSPLAAIWVGEAENSACTRTQQQCACTQICL